VRPVLARTTDVEWSDAPTWNVPVGEVRYFWDPVRRDSLASWIAANIDPTARGSQGLAVFSEPSQALNSPEWREELLLRARLWHTAATKLAGKASVLFSAETNVSVVDEKETLHYIDWTAALLRFAEVVYVTGSSVEVKL